MQTFENIVLVFLESIKSWKSQRSIWNSVEHLRRLVISPFSDFRRNIGNTKEFSSFLPSIDRKNVSSLTLMMNVFCKNS